MVPDKVTIFLIRETCLFALLFYLQDSLQESIKLTYEGGTKWNLNAMLFNIESLTMEPSIKVLLLLNWSELT